MNKQPKTNQQAPVAVCGLPVRTGLQAGATDIASLSKMLGTGLVITVTPVAASPVTTTATSPVTTTSTVT